MAKRKFNFENALAELEQTVERLEDGELDLEASLKAFEKGVTLTRDCQEALQKAEQKVTLLIQKNGNDTLIPFEDEHDD
ncbi:MAG: exodeoxyribonuclease VII small subunit [Gammaproteobacteria bacterium]|nr:exodeoxyribonuclease VII small subunit [Gammaproteobacteria bacterium]